MLLPVCGLVLPAHHLAVGAGGVYHHAGGYHYAYVAYLGVIVAVEADKVALFELVYIAILICNILSVNMIFSF